MRTFNAEQREAVERAGRIFVSAGAGTGKTAVLVERVLRRVLAGTAVDRLLVITFTDRAAAELKRRVREELELRGERERARAVDGAWISTIHRFCARVLRANAFAAGLDPRFAVTDETQARILQSEAFELALEEFVATEHLRRIDLLAAYGRERLREMLLEAFARLRSAGRELQLVPRGARDLGEALQAARSAAEELGDERPAALLAHLESADGHEALRDLSAFRLRASERTVRYEAARQGVEAAARDCAGLADLELLDDLLRRFDARYQDAKDRRSLVDFEDLELRTRELLRSSEVVRRALRERFAAVLVDEFQDTNRLQWELIELVAGDEVFLVGDEFQSIYRFRHADVDVYRARRVEAGTGAVALRRNYRSRPHVLATVNELFGREFGARYEPLLAEGAFDGPAPADGRVELILADKAAFRAAGESWREAEARALAERLAELVDAGTFRPGQIVVLFEAGTDAARYEAALRARHLKTVRATGRGYYQQQQVADLLAYLRLLRNRYDDVALLSVLASPLVGMSNDGLLLVRRAAPRRPLFTAFERDQLPEGLAPEDARLARAFLVRYGRLAPRSAELGLERLCELVVTEHDYDLACLAQPDGDRRYANVRKLARLASEFEALRGPDLEGFIRFCEEQRTLAAREGEAAIAEEGRDAVVLMTVHAAKGLEFDVVALADQGRDREARRAPDVVVDRAGRVGVRVPDPAGGALAPALGHDEAAEEEALADREEGRRLQYVALTRAREHLLVSGGLAPGEETPLGRLCALLGVGLDAPGELEVGGARLAVRVVRPEAPANGLAPAGAPSTAAIGEQLELFAEGGRVVRPLEPLAPLPAAPDVALRRLSYSALALYERCGYRFFAQRVLGLPERAREPLEAGAGLAAVEIGDAVHVLLEDPGADWRARHPHAAEEDAERVAALVAAWERSSLARRVGALEGVERELPFAFELDGVLFHGRFDVHAPLEDGSALVVDYKTNALAERSAAELVQESYQAQVTVYALAALRAGAPAVEVVYAFLEQPDAVWTRRFAATDVPELEQALRATMARIRAGDFPPVPGAQCADCPALELLCAGPRLAVEA